jgi:hypothetical protein
MPAMIQISLLINRKKFCLDNLERAGERAL